MSDIYDGNGNRIGYLSGSGMDLGGCLSLGAMIFVVMTVWKIAKPFWSAMQAKGVHPVFILLMIGAALAAIIFAIAVLLRMRPVRLVGATALSALCGYFIFTKVAQSSDMIWAGAALGVFAIFAFRFIRWAAHLDDDLASVFFL